MHLSNAFGVLLNVWTRFLCPVCNNGDFSAGPRPWKSVPSDFHVHCLHIDSFCSLNLLHLPAFGEGHCSCLFFLPVLLGFTRFSFVFCTSSPLLLQFFSPESPYVLSSTRGFRSHRPFLPIGPASLTASPNQSSDRKLNGPRSIQLPGA